MRGSAFKILAATPASQQKLYKDLIFASLRKSVSCDCERLVDREFENDINKYSGFYIAETCLHPELTPIVDEIFSNPDLQNFCK